MPIRGLHYMAKVKGIKKALIDRNKKNKTIFVRIPSILEAGLNEALELGLSSSLSDFIRNAIELKLEKLGLYEELIKKRKAGKI